MIDRFLYNCFAKLDVMCSWIDKLFAPRCKCKKKNSKRTYEKEKDHGTDISFENEVNNGK